MLLCAVVIIVMDHSAASVMAQRGGRHRRTFQVAANVVDVLPRMFSLFRKVNFPAALELDLKELAPLTIVTNTRIVGVG